MPNLQNPPSWLREKSRAFIPPIVHTRLYLMRSPPNLFQIIQNYLPVRTSRTSAFWMDGFRLDFSRIDKKEIYWHLLWTIFKKVFFWIWWDFRWDKIGGDLRYWLLLFFLRFRFSGGCNSQCKGGCQRKGEGRENNTFAQINNTKNTKVQKCKNTKVQTCKITTVQNYQRACQRNWGKL